MTRDAPPDPERRSDRSDSAAEGDGSRDWDGPDRPPETAREWVRWVRTVESGPVRFFREVVYSVAFVLALGLLVVAISGAYPPLVAVSSGSMEPNLQKGDMVLVVDEGRYAGDAAVRGTGVVTYRSSEGYSRFHREGDVIVYEPNGGSDREIIHRARFWVEEGENWYDEADPEYVNADDCAELRNCPAPNSGFITKGDANGRYDQAWGLSRPVEPSWIEGKAVVRIPLLGRLRLALGTLAGVGGVGRGAALAGGFAVAASRLLGE